jgi:replication factor C small subunit
MKSSFIYKYKPIILDDFDKDKELIDILKTMITIDSLNILFIGDLGCGKTSLINAIIHDYYNNDVKYRDNILTINTLKEQGILYYRNEVKNFCQTKSSIYGKKKIILLDDFDHINEQSQQIFRSYIDKYSSNVHFIASCNQSQKVIESIQSRLNIIKIKPLTTENIRKIIHKISVKEDLNLSDEIETFIISISNHSIKLIINYLEKIKLIGLPITIQLVTEICTNIPFMEFQKYILFCKKDKDLKQSISILYELINKGYSVIDILDNFFIFVKTTELLEEEEKYRIIQYICKYITIFHNVHEHEIELALFTNNIMDIF